MFLGFNPRARVGRDACARLKDSNRSLFQSTRPRGARPRAPWDALSPLSFQSTRPRGARPDQQQNYFNALKFQSTRPRGARRTCSATALRPPCFNPRARVGRDVGVDQQQRVVGVSIHAPAWGATSHMCRPSTCRSGFNPRARVGRDIKAGTIRDRAGKFQSTRPRGARLSPNWTNTNYSTKQSYIKAATKLTKITRPAVPQFCCQGTRANIVINQHHLPFARHRARRLAKPQGHKVSSHQNAPPFFANSSRGYIHAGYLLTHQ